MYGVVVFKENRVIHGVISNLVKITSDSIFGADGSMEGINMDVCDIYAVDTEVAVGEVFPNGLEDFSTQFIFESDAEKIARLEQQNTSLMLAVAKMAEDNESENTKVQLAIAELAEVIANG